MKPFGLGGALLAMALAAPSQSLPEGRGKKIVEGVCSDCHSLEVVLTERAMREGWASIVDYMIQRGATIPDNEVRVIVDYLAANFGKGDKVNINKASVKEIEEGLALTSKEAEAIVGYRKEHGDFKDWDSLAKVDGVDAKKLAAKKDKVSF